MKTKDQKQQIVQDLTEKLSRAKSVVFADYQGLTMKQLSALRNKLNELQAQFLVTKNTLLELALQKNNLTIPEEIKSGPTATLFSFDDEITPMKILVQTLTEAQKGLAISQRMSQTKCGNCGHRLDTVEVIRDRVRVIDVYQWRDDAFALTEKYESNDVEAKKIVEVAERMSGLVSRISSRKPTAWEKTLNGKKIF